MGEIFCLGDDLTMMDLGYYGATGCVIDERGMNNSTSQRRFLNA